MGSRHASLVDWSLRTSAPDVFAAGAFKSGFGSGWYLFNYMNPTDFQTEFNTVTDAVNNFRIVDMSVSLNGASQPRYTGIFLPDTINNSASTNSR